MSRILVLVCVALSSLLPLQAAKFRLRSLCFRPQAGMENTYLVSGAGSEFVELPLMRSFSDPVEITTSGDRLVFFEKKPQSIEDAKTMKPLAQVKVSGKSRILLLFLPNPNKEGSPFKVLTFPDDVDSFPWGSFRLLNLTNTDARFHLGEYSDKKAITLAPGTNATVPRIRKRNPYNMFNVRVEFKTKKGFMIVSNTRWKSVATKRNLAIAFIDPGSGRPVVELYDDIQVPDLGPKEDADL